jgi:uncharacterized membrane protein
MIEIIPNWHPIWVHFPIALLTMAALLMVLATLRTTAPWAGTLTQVARWNLFIGGLALAPTLISGHLAYGSVAHDGAGHDAMHRHMAAAWTTALLFLPALILAWRERQRAVGAGPAVLALMIAGTLALSTTAWLGAENVYRHGIGVERLPDPADHQHHDHKAKAGGHQHHDHKPGAVNHPHHGSHQSGTPAASSGHRHPPVTSDAGDLTGRLPEITVWHSPTCGCCGDWVDHLEAYGFPVRKHLQRDVALIKHRLALPGELASCHTAMVDGYVVEGHVPAEDIARLLQERPFVRGIAVPGMPIGSPGMEMGDRRDAYEVLTFDEQGNTEVFSRYPR